MLKLFKQLKPFEWLLIIISVGFIVAQVWLDLKMPDYMKEMSDAIMKTDSSISAVWEHGGMMLLCALGSFLSAVIVSFFVARIAAVMSMRLRSGLFDKVASFSMEEINRFSTESLITRSTNDITQIQMIVSMGLQMTIKAPILGVWAVLKILGKGWEWSLTTAASIILMSIMIVFVLIFVLPKFKKMQTLTDNLTRVTRENLTGLRVVRAYNAEGYQMKKFKAANDELTGTQLFTSRAMSILMPFMMLIMSGLSLAIYWVGAHLIEGEKILEAKAGLFTDMIVFSSYAMQVVMAFILLVMLFIMLPRASVSARRVNEVLETEPTIKDGFYNGEEDSVKGEVEFKNVSFKYPGAAEYVIENISFKAKKGETVAFIGSTGSGKSTLINLVPRFYDATDGEVLIDGRNIQDYTFEALYNKIGYVPQRAVMFMGTVTSNVALGNNGRGEYTAEQVKKAVEIAQGKGFVEEMEDTYNAEIAQGGTNVSGGQKQRLAIARAVCRDPEIYIFDDSFSALDYRTDRLLRTELKKQMSGATSLIVAQRIGTILDADKIIVLDEGKIVGSGTHRELLSSCEVYREIAMSQLSKEELDNE